MGWRRRKCCGSQRRRSSTASIRWRKRWWRRRKIGGGGVGVGEEELMTALGGDSAGSVGVQADRAGEEGRTQRSAPTAGSTQIFVGRRDGGGVEAIGVISVADEIKEDSVRAVREFH